jgi:two-component system nitrogen regulation sensor histidine kinase NtrY
VQLTLKLRIYLSMMVIILIAFIVTFGISTANYNAQNELYNEQRLFKKEEAVINSMNYYMVQHQQTVHPDSVAEFFSDKICELSDVHDMFIALFNLKGRYIISSSFDKMDSLGIPEQINYSILKQLSTGNQRAVIDRDFRHEQYALAYWYFYDSKGKPIGITNVVYEKSLEKREEHEDFLKNLTKSYVILFLIAAGLAYLLSSYITRTLQTVTKKMREVHLGATNEPIEWNGNDEIGQLVNEYNNMLKKLDESASKLAKTERESAWREMAQQVAHEIKNPLTPMKLRTQQLLRSWKDQPNDFNQKLELYSKGMIEQIDALANIASEFSSFAKMPKAALLPVNLVDLVESVTSLYQQDSKTEIHLRKYNIQNEILLLDKDQIIRVLNNIITNALQAIPTDRKGKIDIAIRGYKKGIIVRIQDNGTGISEEVKQKLFVPNFTTKSTGSGLGLTMVKNIMLQNNGTVRCFSNEQQGTSFFLFFDA